MIAYDSTTGAPSLPTGELFALAASLTRYAEVHTGARRWAALYLQRWSEREALDRAVGAERREKESKWE